LEEGLICEEDLDITVKHILTHKFANGLFDNGPTDPRRAVNFLDNSAHRKLSREATEQGAVLLINKDNALPLGSLTGKKIALLGPTASSECNCSDATNVVMGSYSLPGAHVVTLDEAFRNASAIVTWKPGMRSAAGIPGTGEDSQLLQEAVDAAKTADVAVLMLGDVQGSGTGACGEWNDRDNLDLQGGQLSLLEAVADVAKKTIVILVHGRPQTFGPGNVILDKVDGMFATFRPGEEFGHAMVSLMSGEISPSGKLAQSWPQNVGQIGGGSNPWLQAVRGKWVANKKTDFDADGRWYDAYQSSPDKPVPLFYFGHGLSYTSFTYKSLHVTTDTKNDDILWNVAVTLRNSGNVAATEIVQVYVQDPVGLPFVPYWKRLIGFQRVYLIAGAEATVNIDILSDDVGQYSNDDTPVLTLYPGMYQITAGGASNAAVQTVNVTLSAR
jgi:hypothetical protein